MNQVEKFFFRFMNNVHICSLDNAVKSLSEIEENCNEGKTQNIQQIISSINTAVKGFDIEITQGKCELTGNDYIALVNVAASNVDGHAKFHDKKTIAFFSSMVRAIVFSGKGYLTDTECLNMETETSKSNMQQAIATLAKQQWLTIVSGNVFIGVRAILELGQVLSQHYPDHVKQCPLCKHCVLFGSICQNCECKLHVHCLKKYAERSTNCPDCKASWQSDNSPRNSNSPTTDSGPSQRKRFRTSNDPS